MADIEKVINGLKCCTHAKAQIPCGDCSYCGNDDYNDAWSCRIALMKDALELLKEQKEQLDTQKENFAHLAAKLATQPQIVRCKDCKHYDKDPYCKGFGDCAGACDNLVKVHDDWFCADGERKSD